MATKPSNLKELWAAANAALAAGDVGSAESIAERLRGLFPERPPGYVLLARCAGERGDWLEALNRWERCQTLFPSDAGTWSASRAESLWRCGREKEAEAAYRDIADADPDNASAQAGLARVVATQGAHLALPYWRRALELKGGDAPLDWKLSYARALDDSGDPEAGIETASVARELIRTGQRQQAAHELNRGVLSNPARAPMGRLKLLIWLGRRAEARQAFWVANEMTRTAAGLTALFDLAPQLFGPVQLGQAHRALNVKANTLSDPNDASLSALRLRLDYAMGDFPTLLQRFKQGPPTDETWRRRFARLAEVLASPRFPDFQAPKVFGIGLSRTGTTSLGQALEMLGYLQAHFLNPFTMASLSDRDFTIFDAATDTPIAMRLEYLYWLFPNAKFILTTRSYESWEASVTRYFEKRFGGANFPELRALMAQDRDSDVGLNRMLVNTGLFLRYKSFREAHEVFHARVDRFFADKPVAKFLRLDASDGRGWPSLCAFLDVAVPDSPYPWENRSSHAAESRADDLSSHASGAATS